MNLVRLGWQVCGFRPLDGVAREVRELHVGPSVHATLRDGEDVVDGGVSSFDAKTADATQVSIALHQTNDGNPGIDDRHLVPLELLKSRPLSVVLGVPLDPLRSALST